MRKPLEQRFWEKVKKTDSCWFWIGSKDNGGYGHIGIGGRNGKIVKVHRLSYEIHFGEIPKTEGYHGLCVCHRCDNRHCVNPDHLFLGTQKENIADMKVKGRGADRFGENNPLAKLTQDDVKDIRALRLKEKLTFKELGDRYGVSYGTIFSVIKNKTWR